MLQSWTSTLVKFHTASSAQRVNKACHPTSDNPGQKKSTDLDT